MSRPSWIEKLDDFVLDCLLYVLSIKIKPIQLRSDPVIQTIPMILRLLKIC